MPTTVGPGFSRGARTGASVTVVGLAELQRAFKAVDKGSHRELRKRLRAIGNTVRDRARDNIEHKTGRHGDPNLPPLASTVKTSISARSVSVYSDQIYARIQDTGGRVGHGAIVTRASASAYMLRAYQDGQQEVAEELDRLGAWAESTFAKGG